LTNKSKSLSNLAQALMNCGYDKFFDIVLSDFEAGNNVYLYGGAGTGKTFIAGQIAKALNYKLVTLNCNQFTSPLDIIGGQTIEGYQEGRLTYAFGNLWNPNEVNEKTGKPYSGALLLLDELPKLDPNTAGDLNDGLSKIKETVEQVEELQKSFLVKIDS
jgi:cobaltochelatase CobS